MQSPKKTTLFAHEVVCLMDFLQKKMGGMSRNKIKSILKYNQVKINGNIETHFDFKLKDGDKIEIYFNENSRFFHPKIKIIYEDEFILAVDKSTGLLTNATSAEKEKTAFSILLDYIRNINCKNELYYVHRLDRDVSGVLIFAKNKKTQIELQNSWHSENNEKIYFALVEGVVEKEFGTIESWLTEDDKSKRVYSQSFDNGGKYSVLNYIVINRTKYNTLLQIELITGRKNQIRVQMQSIGHSIAGDKKYGGKKSPINRLGLHAGSVTIKHPKTGNIVKFESSIPKCFY